MIDLHCVYQAILDSISEPVCVLDLDKNLIYLNPASERLTGRSLSDAQGRRCSQILSIAEEICRTACPVDRLMADKLASYRHVCQLAGRSIGLREMQVSVFPLHDDRKTVAGTVVILQDITERLQAERAQKQRVAQLALLNEVGGQITAELELDSVLHRAVRLVQENFGYHHVAIFLTDKAQEMALMRARAGAYVELFPPDHSVPVGRGMVGWVAKRGLKLLANDVLREPHYINFYPGVIPTEAELAVPIRVAAETVGVLDVQSPHLNAFDANDVMVIETLADQIAVAIENARLYKALQASEEWYRTIAENIHDGLTLIQNGQVVYVNSRACEIFGYPKDELCNLTDLDFSPPQDQASKAWSQFIADQLNAQPVEQEFWIERKDGTRRCVRNRYTVVRRNGTNVTRWVVTTDITRHKELTQQMVRAERLAAMGYVAATLAHEIKNPLQAIHSNLELVLDYPLEPEAQRECLELCQREVEGLVGITQRVLSFASSNRRAHRPTALQELLQNTLDLLRKPLQKANVEARAEFPASLPPVLVVPDQITQVLLNLLINMVEAMFKGGTITVTGRTEMAQAGEMVVLALANDGPPIPPQQLDHVFDPFFTTKPDGTGLGLFISHTIVQQHGGSLTVRNLPGEGGVVFELSLPAAADRTGEVGGA